MNFGQHCDGDADDYDDFKKPGPGWMFAGEQHTNAKQTFSFLFFLFLFFFLSNILYESTSMFPQIGQQTQPTSHPLLLLPSTTESPQQL